MKLTLLLWLAGIMGAITIGVFGYIMYLRYNEGEEPENATIIENYMPQYSGGHTDGLVTEMLIGDNGRIKITIIDSSSKTILTL